MHIDFEIDIDHIDDLRLKSYKITSNPRNCLSDFFPVSLGTGVLRSAPKHSLIALELLHLGPAGGMDFRRFGDWIISLPALFQIEKCSFFFFGCLPLKNGDFPWQTVSHNQMVMIFI